MEIQKIVLELIENVTNNVSFSPQSDFSDRSPCSPGLLATRRNLVNLTLKVPKYLPEKDDVLPEENIKLKYDPEEGLLFHELRMKEKTS